MRAQKLFFQLLAVAGAVAIFWGDLAVTHALSWASVLVHELGHAVAALLTGGEVLRVMLTDEFGGAARTMGGIPEVISAAGYTASALLGALWLAASGSQAAARWVSSTTGMALAAALLLPLEGGTRLAAVGLAAGSGLIALLTYDRLTWPMAGLLLRIAGTYWCGYAVVDLWGDSMQATSAGSDAETLSQLSGLPSGLIGAAWLLALVALSLWAAVRSVQPTPFRLAPAVR